MPKRISIVKKYVGEYKKSNIKYTSNKRPYVVTKYGAVFVPSNYKGGKLYKNVYKTSKSFSPIKPYKTTKPYYLGSPYRPIRTKKPPIVLRSNNVFVKRSLPKSVQTFYVVEKVRGKFKKLYPKPLTLKDARDYAVYSIDNRLSKTAFFVPLGKAKQVISVPKQIQNYYSRNSRKVRPYRIRFGKRKQLVNGFIEKRRYFNDTRGERLQLTRLNRGKLRKISNSSKNNRVVVNNQFSRRTNISPQRRRQLIQQLQRARAIRMRNLGRTTTIPLARRNIVVNRRINKQLRRKITSPRRPINPQQRRILLQRLKKARMVRMANLRKRR